MRFLSLIEKKRDGLDLSAGEIQFIIQEVTAGRVPEYQAAALLMAIFWRGLNSAETRHLTIAMRDSGETLRFPDDPRPLVDKHSTGGVGDKVSLPLAPLLACLGFRVPMISGRGLGITGGTLDKLESIPGFRTKLTSPEITSIVQRVGCVICGQSETMAPADRKLYALRDATGTVPSIPLITASILSKKLAENLDALALDVKFGSGAFMKTLDQARLLAQSMAGIGRDIGVKITALLTDMNNVLGRTAGNWLEVKESIEFLEGRGPADIKELVLECAAQILLLANKSTSAEKAREAAGACLAGGEPRRKWDEMIEAQGADLVAFNELLKTDARAPVVLELSEFRKIAGYVVRCDAELIGQIVRDLGGGRWTKEDSVDHTVGVDRLLKPGDELPARDLVPRVHARTQSEAESAALQLAHAIQIANSPPPSQPLIAEILA